jgi:intracellular sulfur oxidation DsrE/DsrF family protein
MSRNPDLFSSARRAFLARVGVGAAAFTTVGGTPAVAQVRSAPFQPAKHAEDDWMDGLPGKHRLVFDTTTPTGADTVRRFVENYFFSSKAGYGLEPSDLAVIVILRHHATPFAYNDAMWAKYGAAIADELKFTDPSTSQAPTHNLYNASDITFDSLAGRGVHYAVCGMATRYFAGVAARKSGASADEIYRDLAANLVRNSHVVPAGIVAVNRTQERGYTFAFVG